MFVLHSEKPQILPAGANRTTGPLTRRRPSRLRTPLIVKIITRGLRRLGSACSCRYAALLRASTRPPSIGLMMVPMDRLIRLAALARAPGLLGRIRRTWDLYRTAGWPYVHRQLRRHLSDDNNYNKWVPVRHAHDRARAAMGRRMAQMAAPPLISVVMPTYNPNPAWLREAIESVRAQIYPNWELCIADDASPSQEVRDMLKATRAATRASRSCSGRRTATSRRRRTAPSNW